mgnify:CR=1 FL=1
MWHQLTGTEGNVIDKVEKVLESYGYDEELKKALREIYFRRDTRFKLFPTNYPTGHSRYYFLGLDGGIRVGCTDVFDSLGEPSSSEDAAEKYIHDLEFRCRSYITLTQVKAMLKKDINERIKQLKDYVKSPNWDYNRLAEITELPYLLGGITLTLCEIR